MYQYFSPEDGHRMFFRYVGTHKFTRHCSSKNQHTQVKFVAFAYLSTDLACGSTTSSLTSILEKASNFMIHLEETEFEGRRSVELR
jgi:hypothetical protein